MSLNQVDGSEDAANARLIAAAPVLFEALREVVTNGEHDGPDWRISAAVYEMAHAAIATARGDQ